MNTKRLFSTALITVSLSLGFAAAASADEGSTFSAIDGESCASCPAPALASDDNGSQSLSSTRESTSHSYSDRR